MVIKCNQWGSFSSKSLSEIVLQNYAYGFTKSKILNEQHLCFTQNFFYPFHNKKCTLKAYSQLRYPKGLSNEKRIAKDYFGF
jgi:hypothetical protein